MKPIRREPPSGAGTRLIDISGLAILNRIFFDRAWLDQSWGTVWVALFHGPCIGEFLAPGAILFMYPAGQLTKLSPWNRLLAYKKLPSAEIALAWFAISTMPLHGC